MAKVGILHTSFVFVNVDPVLRNLFRELLPDVQVTDFVDSDVLEQVRRDGVVTASTVKRMRHMALAAEAAGVDLILSACSSLGPAVDEARRSVKVPIVKIDDAMAEEAVRIGGRIGILATMPTTVKPSAELVHEHAARLGRKVETTVRLCEGAFDLLMGGDRPAHDAAVVAGALDLADTCDVIVLAQASMARLAPTLVEKTARPVLASPRMCVEDLRQRLHQPARVS